MKLYEAMFLVNNNAAKENYEKVEAEVQSCITRFGGEIVNSIKWDDRRLAYEIMKQKRATYIVVHFNADGDSISKIERQCRLSEVILRVLIVADEDGADVQPYSSYSESENVDFDNKAGAGRRSEAKSGVDSE